MWSSQFTIRIQERDVCVTVGDDIRFGGRELKAVVSAGSCSGEGSDYVA
jgi:hypothetical protein